MQTWPKLLEFGFEEFLILHDFINTTHLNLQVVAIIPLKISYTEKFNPS